MKSRMHLFGHPLHPMLIAFPTAIFPLLLLLDGLRLFTGDAYEGAAFWLTLAGIAATLAAMVPGIVDLAAIPNASRAHRTAVVHLVGGIVVLALYGVGALVRWPVGSVPSAVLALGVDGLGVLAITVQGWLGGHLVFHHHLAVLSKEEGAEPTPFDAKGDAAPADGPSGARRT